MNWKRPGVPMALALLSLSAWCGPSMNGSESSIVWPSAGSVITATPLKVTIEAPETVAGRFGVTINGKPIELLFSRAENGKSSALLRGRNLRIGQNELTVRYANHEASSVEFTYAPGASAEVGGTESPASRSPDYLAIHTRLVGGMGVNPGDYYTQVGSSRYVAPDGNGVTGFHVVALDRGDASLKFNIVVPNIGLPIPEIGAVIQQQAASSCTGQWGCILIISSMQKIGPTPCPTFPKGQCSYEYDPGASLEYFGGTFRINFLDGTRETNSYSMITTIGQNGGARRGQGQADERVACQSSSGCLYDFDPPNVWTGYGDITGALVADNNNALTFTRVSRPTFSIQATPNAGDVNTITVNGQQYSASLGGEPGGFHVLILDASYLGATFNYALPISSSGLSTLLQGVGAYLQGSGATQNILVFVASMGSMDHSSVEAQWLQVAELFSRFGGTYHLISGLQSGDDYAMIGAPPTYSLYEATVPPAVESSSVIARHASLLNPLPPTQMLGFLEKNRFGYYRAGASNLACNTKTTTFSNAANAIESALLDKAALQSPVLWPFCLNGCSNNDGSNTQLNVYQAISYYLTVIGTGSGNPDIRSIYPQDEGSVWAQYESNLSDPGFTPAVLQTWLAQHEPAKPYLANFSSSDFSTVQSQLEAELSYVVLIHGYESNLSKAVNKNETNLEFEIQNIYDELATELQVSKQSQSPVEADIVNAIAGGLSVASYAFPEAPEVALGLDAASVGLSYSMSLVNHQSGVPIVADQLRSTVADLETDTNLNFTRSLDSLGNMFSLIYQDERRLQTLGAALANNPVPLIQWTSNTANSYVQTMAKSMGRQYTGAFFSTLYNVYTWQDLTSGGPPGKNYLAICNAEGVSSGDCPLGQHFDGSDWLNIRDKPNGQNPSSNNDGNYWNVLLMADQNASFHGHEYDCYKEACACEQQVHGAYPFDSVMQQIFAPIGTYPNQADNLGIYPLWFFTKYGIPQQPFFAHTGCTHSGVQF